MEHITAASEIALSRKPYNWNDLRAQQMERGETWRVCPFHLVLILAAINRYCWSCAASIGSVKQPLLTTTGTCCSLEQAS